MKINKLFVPLMAVISLMSVGCSSNNSSASSKNGGSNSNIPSEVQKYTVTFDLNYDGSTKFTQEVESNGKVTRPEDPSRDGFYFTGWYVDANETSQFDFDTSITESKTVYAGWVDSANSLVATFYYNYEGAPSEIYETSYFEKNNRVTKPEDPSRDGYLFSGWYSDAACTQEFSFMKRQDSNVSLYASWKKSYTFEAEYTQLTGLDPDTDETCDAQGNKLGVGYSNNVVGKMLIGKDSDKVKAQASNGYYVTNLYYNGAYLEFKINSDADVTGASLQLRLSAEYFNISITSDDFVVSINDKEISYEDITFSGVVTDMASEEKRPFTNHYINTINLKKGENSIKLTVNNDQSPQVGAGSMGATAPMIDCIYITTDANLTMTEYKGNIQ